MATNTGRNLLDPRDETHSNMTFLAFLCAVIRATDLHADLIRSAIASPGNDHRLGANEAPPAIISLYLGDMLTDIITQLEGGKPSSTKKSGKLDLGALSLPEIPRHTGDRNRTSPFAFTGNKFELRAVGSSAPVAWPNTILNAIVADSLEFISDEIEKAAGARPTASKLKTATQSVLRKIVKEHKRVLFDGDNYSDEWTREAEKRGLPNIKDTVDSLAALKRKENVQVFSKHKIMNRKEVAARLEIFSEHYAKATEIEAQTLLTMSRRLIFPAALRHQSDLAESVASTEAVDLDPGEVRAELELFVDLTSRFRAAVEKLQKAVEESRPEDPIKHAAAVRDAVIPRVADVRELADDIERRVADDLWPVPTYRELLFIK